MLLLADSGSTKVEWAIIKEGRECKKIVTQGINPHFQTSNEIVAALNEQLLPLLDGEEPNELIFYSAGVATPKFAMELTQVFSSLFTQCAVEVESDLLAAARALCGDSPGVVGILGTGSNSCYYNGQETLQKSFAGGYILGDEGSGAYFGRRVIGDWIKGVIPKELGEKFEKGYSLSYEKVVERVYRAPFPNRYLASFSTFLECEREHPYVKELLTDGFKSFIERSLHHYPYHTSPVNLVGSIASIFQREIEALFYRESIELGRVLKSPMEELIKYHIDRR
ncbi:MAG: ATPase [Bacteroidales bacterium]